MIVIVGLGSLQGRVNKSITNCRKKQHGLVWIQGPFIYKHIGPKLNENNVLKESFD